MSRYAPALIQIAIALVGALSQLTGHLTLVEALQLAVLALNSFTVYLLPLIGEEQTRSGLKTGFAIAGAVATAAIPYALNHAITGPEIALVVLAGLQALGAHIGVQIRNDAANTPAPIAAIPAPVIEPPTETTVQRAISVNKGEFLGEPAR